jgi:uncharacterized membrane protein
VIATCFILANVVLGARAWLWPAIALATVALLALLIAYVRTSSPGWLRAACVLLKAAAVVLLAICLVEPMFTGTRPRPGDNLFLVVADNSRSLQLADRGAGRSRGTIMQAELSEKSSWLTRLAQDYDVRRYTFDTALHPVQDFSGLTLDGEASTLTAAIDSLRERFHGQPVAGILVLTDGNATDSGMEARRVSEEATPPIYPVALASAAEAVDLSVTQIAVSQTNFDAAPVTIAAEFAAQSLGQRQVVVRVLDEAGKELERRTLAAGEGQPLAQRFLIKPEKPGISFYQVQASVGGEEEVKPGRTVEATLANNRRLATVDRGGGPYRVLYVGGMPNWEFKFLRRAISADDEVQLVGLVRIAKREPKFTFLSRSGERTNPLFRGFGNTGEQTEEYDQPVLVRLGTEDKDELRGGFPKDAEDLFAYHAVVLDDIEAAFFTQDQLSLLQRFVGQRGGGLLMMGGKNSFQEGGFARSPVGEMLPVYLDRSAPLSPSGGYRLKLTREGWLQPWVRVRATEEEESQRLASMPAFKSLNRIDAIKPGASVLAEVEDNSGPRPALVVQPFGRGRVGALMLGDLWRWDLRREDHAQSDLEKSWRQTVRWLVADVPQRVEVETRRAEGAGLAPQEIIVRARDKQFAPLDNASVSITVKTPDKRELTIVAESSDSTAGEYHATFSPRVAGAYRAEVSVTAADGSDVGRRETGWAVEPETEEFRSLSGNRALLERLADDSGGEVIEVDTLDSFVSGLPNRKIPITENWTYPLWHQWTVLALAIGCLVGEWGLRRWRGLP